MSAAAADVCQLCGGFPAVFRRLPLDHPLFPDRIMLPRPAAATGGEALCGPCVAGLPGVICPGSGTQTFAEPGVQPCSVCEQRIAITVHDQDGIFIVHSTRA